MSMNQISRCDQIIIKQTVEDEYVGEGWAVGIGVAAGVESRLLLGGNGGGVCGVPVSTKSII